MKNNYSIITLEQEIYKQNQIKHKTKQQKEEYKRLKQNLNQIYNNNKKFIIELEKTNYEYLAFMRSTHGFYKLFEHSALFYACNIAPKLNLRANLQADGDFSNKSSVGFVSVREPAKISGALQSIGIKQVKTKDQTGNYLLFKLPWRFTDEQITAMVEDQHFWMQKFNHIVLVDNMIPVLFLQLEELLKVLYENVRGMGGPVERETMGYDLVKAANRMNHRYLDLTNGLTDRQTCLNDLKDELKFIKYQTKLIADLKIWAPKTSARITETIIKIQDIINHELRNE